MPVSAGLLADTDAYFAALTSYRDGNAAPIVERFSRATVLAIANGRQLVSELREIRENWNDVISARSDSAVWKVADLLTRRPVVNAALLAQELGMDPPTLIATSIHSPRRESSLRQPTGPATACGDLRKYLPHLMPSPNVRAGAADLVHPTANVDPRWWDLPHIERDDHGASRCAGRDVTTIVRSLRREAAGLASRGDAAEGAVDTRRHRL